jgi:hypothetical protein
MPNTYTELARYVVTGSNLSGPTGVTFTGISSAYTDLRIVQSVTLTAAAIGYIQVGNGSIDTAANYSRTTLSGDGSSASSSRTSSTNQISTQVAHQGTTIGTYTADFMNYSNTTTNKTVLIRNNNTGFGTEAAVGLWRSTSAINTVKLFLDRAEFYVVGSTFSLYGIANADQGAAKATGGIITEDSQYWYHTFAASGTFTPKVALTCDYLVVAGGGGGGWYQNAAGGGGGGGLRSTVTATGGGGALESALSVAAGVGLTVTVGAGGAGATSNGAPGANGSNSVFSTITSTGGGRGGSWDGFAPNTGGSGGGGYAIDPSFTQSGAAGTANQGFAGGTSAIYDSYGWGGGGGGAGAVGKTGGLTDKGVGGAGVAVAISGTSTFYAGGGGGGKDGRSTNQTGNVGGVGGGGNGTNDTEAGTNGTANTGGGGGGGGAGISSSTFSGGSGLVIVRYAK